MSLLQAQSYINEKWIPAETERITVISPYSGEIIGNKSLATPANVESALSSASLAKKDIAQMPSYKRAEILKTAARLLERDKVRLSRLSALELGKPLRESLAEVLRSIETLEQSGEEAKRLIGETIPGDVSERGVSAIATTFRVPVGVVCTITPFNAPLNLVCHKVAPAFAAGNSIIFKPSSQTTLIAAEFIKLLLESGFPANAINMLLSGADTVRKLVSDDRVNLVSFTGGLAAAQSICTWAGIKKVLLELGGNAATIVHDDADLSRASNLCAKTGFSNSGQTCISVQRIYVHRSVIAKFTRLLEREVSKLKFGDPLIVRYRHWLFNRFRCGQKGHRLDS